MNRLEKLMARYRELGLRGLVSSALARFDKLDFVQFRLRRMLIPWRVSHISGPRHFSCEQDEVVVISVVRNGELWIRSFLNHHRLIGIKRFVILDNGSTDQTVAILAKEGDVTLLRTSAPYSAYENTMKRYLAERYCRGRWCLCVDVDELFSYPLSERMSLNQLVRYLNWRGYNAVVTQMLDMFSDAPLADVVSMPEDHLIEKYRFYDITNIEATKYNFEVPDERIKMHWGGIRRTVFGTNNGLTKVSLFRMDGRLKPFVYWHHALEAKIADVSCVLLHFPFVSSFYTKVTEAVKSGRYGYVTSDEYKSYLEGLERSPELVLKLPTARMLTGGDDLLQNGFLIASQAYVEWVDSDPSRSSARGAALRKASPHRLAG